MKTLLSTLDFTLDYIEPKCLCSLEAYVDASMDLVGWKMPLLWVQKNSPIQLDLKTHDS